MGQAWAMMPLFSVLFIHFMRVLWDGGGEVGQCKGWGCIWTGPAAVSDILGIRGKKFIRPSREALGEDDGNCNGTTDKGEKAMIMARTVIQTKWGKADEVVNGMKEMMKGGPMPEGGHKVTLMTDLSGEFHTVIMESQFDSLAAWEKFRATMFTGQDSGGDGPGGQDNMEEMMVSGRQEFYTIEAEF